MYRLIIVEDETLIRQWLTQALDYHQLGLEVVAVAKDGLEGASLIKTLKPHVVLTDIKMPHKTAFEMFEVTKEVAYEKVILSSYSDFQHAKKAMQYGVYNFIEKPIDLEELRDCLWQIQLDLKKKDDSSSAEEKEPIWSDFSSLNLPQVMSEDWAKELVEWLHLNYDKPIATEDLAKHFGYSESYLYKKIKEELGITLTDYLNRYRIKRAIQLMMSLPDVKAYEVSEAVGFSDYNYFGKVFRRYTGLSFTEFKENFTHKG
ncbi:helix-turn-helix domain-containing protein [Streptococcus zalophi]|uniref:Response regulator n=1 Tax=Streptococcus zalophi TaxID=640031 RepID=A0A934PAL5_9STRE|nr:helix-turn-helix domain-containing protein [Streptococcus zalophi]MBJ8350003.1 response regulator [Streptococcus zalophi]MCR8967009.1 response regulator [Streptococcus zalophi]